VKRVNLSNLRLAMLMRSGSGVVALWLCRVVHL
jgi:hypothetical protein